LYYFFSIDYSCVVVPGGFGKRGVESKIEACKWCRVNMKPFLDICLGFQTAVIEFARNVLNLKDANSAECSDTVEHAVIIDMPEHNTGDMGETMRLGKRTTFLSRIFKAKSVS
jgi:CTP synthase